MGCLEDIDKLDGVAELTKASLMLLVARRGAAVNGRAWQCVKMALDRYEASCLQMISIDI